jgi:DNA-binding transcriptional ArsR family regulator
MKVITDSSPFGSRTRTRVLVALGLLGDSYARELARILDTGLSAIQKAIRSLERDRLIAGRLAGRTRLYRFDPRYFAHRDLMRYVARLSAAEPALRDRIATLRRRPRRAGKPL